MLRSSRQLSTTNNSCAQLSRRFSQLDLRAPAYCYPGTRTAQVGGCWRPMEAMNHPPPHTQTHHHHIAPLPPYLWLQHGSAEVLPTCNQMHPAQHLCNPTHLTPAPCDQAPPPPPGCRPVAPTHLWLQHRSAEVLTRQLVHLAGRQLWQTLLLTPTPLLLTTSGTPSQVPAAAAAPAAAAGTCIPLRGCPRCSSSTPNTSQDERRPAIPMHKQPSHCCRHCCRTAATSRRCCRCCRRHPRCGDHPHPRGPVPSRGRRAATTKRRTGAAAGGCAAAAV